MKEDRIPEERIWNKQLLTYAYVKINVTAEDTKPQIERIHLQELSQLFLYYFDFVDVMDERLSSVNHSLMSNSVSPNFVELC